jgi:hypothetical protein
MGLVTAYKRGKPFFKTICPRNRTKGYQDEKSRKNVRIWKINFRFKI